MAAYLYQQVEAVPYQTIGDVVLPLVGRAESLKWLQNALEQGQTVWLSGDAGIGRHTAASYVARSAIAQGTPVLWINAYHDDLAMLAERTLRALPGATPSPVLLQSTRNMIAEQKPLVILTGQLEPQVRADFLARCVPASTSCIVIAASDARLARNEDNQLSLGTLSAANTRQLFEALAPAYTTPADAAAVSTLLHYTEGFPFPTVLAARQLQQTSIDPARLVKLLPRTVPGARPRTLGMIDAAYKLLNSQTQGVLLVLGALFAARTPMVLLQAVIGTENDTELRGMVDTLVKRGLLTHDAHAEGYLVHELLRSYARKRLTASGQQAEMLKRIQKALLRLVLKATDAPSESNFALLASLTDHLLGATRYAAQSGDDHFLETIIKLLGRRGAEGFVESQGYQAYFARLRQVAGLSEASTMQQALGITETTQSAVSATTRQHNRTAPTTADPTQETNPLSVEALQAALSAAEATADRERVRYLNDVLGDWYGNHFDADTAARYYSAALADMQPSDNREAYLSLLLKLCRANVENEDPVQALQHIGEALVLVGEQPGLQGRFLDVSGDARHALKDEQGALDDYRTAMELLDAQGDFAAAGITMGKAANVLLDQREFQEASLLLARAVDLFEKSGRRGLQGQALGNLGTALGYMRRWREAGRRHMMALQIARELGDQEEERYQLGNLAFVSETEGYLEWALLYARQALYVSLQTNDLNAAAHHAFDVGRMLAQQPSMLLQAIVAFEASLRYQESQQTRTFLQQTHQQLAQLNHQEMTPPEELLNYARAAYEA